MNRVIRWVLVLVLVVAGAAAAQPPVPAGPPPQRPPFSPYLNLLRSGNSPALNYYGLVRPEQQFQQSIGNLQGAVTANQQAINGLQANPNGGLMTGHPVQFMNTGGYFLNIGGGGTASFAQPRGPATMGGGGAVSRPGAGGAGVVPPRR